MFTILSRYRYRVAAIHAIVQFSQKFQEKALEKRHGWNSEFNAQSLDRMQSIHTE